MKKKMNLKFKKLLIMLGVSTMAVSLGAGANVAYADSPSDDKSQEYEEGMKEHQDLQAYNYPLVAANLTTTKGNLPSAESGVSNWSSLPAGTTAVWHKQPTIDQEGKSYGTVIVTFPDKSASVIAVYVTVEGDASSQSSSSSSDKIAPKSEVNSSDVKEATAKAQEKADAANKAAAQSTQASDKSSESSKSASQDTSSNEAANANSTNDEDANDQVIVKDVKTEYNKQKTAPKSEEQPTTKSAQISNTAAASNSELPQTQAKKSGLAIVSGIAIAIVGLGMAVINKFKFEK